MSPSVESSTPLRPGLPRRLGAAAGKALFRSRDLVLPLVFLAIVLLTRPAQIGGRWHLALDVAGVALALAGQALRVFVIGFRYIRRGGKNRTIYADDLVQEGVFACSRNPLYTGNMMGLIGFLVVHGSLLGAAIGVPFFVLAYLAIVLAEEEYLEGRFGAAYAEYTRRVPRFLITSLGALRKAVAGIPFDWKRVLRKEYGTTFTGLTALVLVMVWDVYLVGGIEAVRAARPIALGFWVAVLLAYLVVRYLKKTGALGAD